jgi:hypothetical protein
MPEQSMMNKIKDNPIKSIAAVIASLSTIVTTAWAFEARYNQQDEILLVQNDVLEYQIRRTEDRIFEYELKEGQGTATPVDKAMKKRAQEYLRALRDKKEKRLQQK